MITDLYFILAGFGIGLTLAAPGGPVNILCVQRTLSNGRTAGLAVGFGAVIGDGLLALVAASGLSFVAVMLQTFASEIQLAGGAVLILFGLKLTHNRLGDAVPTASLDQTTTGDRAADNALHSHIHMIPQSFLLTVMNPGAMLGAFALFGGLASLVGTLPTATQVLLLVIAVVAGNLTWWVALTRTVCRFRHRVSTERLRTVNWVAGIALMAFGLLLLMRGGITFDLDRLANLTTAAIATFGAA